MKTVRIGLLGFGTVGVGVVDGLRRNGDLIARRAGIRLQVERIADLDLDTPRDVPFDRTKMTADGMSVALDPDIDIVVELIGGTGAARELALAALDAGKPVVTANKALLARHGAELYRAAARRNADLGIEASTAGCIPLLRSIREGLAANRFLGMHGILNGTCNYILTRMETENAAFDDVLREAQARGYAEADPGLDIDGHDTAHKTVIVASLLAGVPMDADSLPVRGIRGLDRNDIRMAGVLGYRVKLLGRVAFDGPEPVADVGPALVPASSLLAQVNHAFNAVMVQSDMAGATMYYGRGAGREPTASAAIADLIDIGRNLALGCPRRVPPGIDPEAAPLRFADATGRPCRRYVRVSHGPDDDTVARLRAVFSEAGIGIAALATRPEPDRPNALSTALTSEPIAEQTARDALLRLNALRKDSAPTVLLNVNEDSNHD